MKQRTTRCFTTYKPQRQQPLIFHFTSLDYTQHPLNPTPDPLFGSGTHSFSAMPTLDLVVMSLLVLLLAVSGVFYAGGTQLATGRSVPTRIAHLLSAPAVEQAGGQAGSSASCLVEA